MICDFSRRPYSWKIYLRKSSWKGYIIGSLCVKKVMKSAGDREGSF
jgi:hypothetical protein